MVCVIYVMCVRLLNSVRLMRLVRPMRPGRVGRICLRACVQRKARFIVNLQDLRRKDAPDAQKCKKPSDPNFRKER